MEDTLQDFTDDLEKAKNPKTGTTYAPGYIESYVKAVRSWAEWNRKPIQRKIKIGNISKRPTLEEERIPSMDELRRVLYAASTPLRTRVSIALMAFAGPRPEVQGDYLGLDGLRIKDFPELKVTPEEVVFTKTPTMIVVREEISKSRHRYVTFLGEEGCEILKEYFDKRIAEGESLTPDSGIIVTSSAQEERRKRFGMTDSSPFLRTTKHSANIREAMRAVGLPWRPYVFRSYFRYKPNAGSQQAVTPATPTNSSGWVTRVTSKLSILPTNTDFLKT